MSDAGVDTGAATAVAPPVSTTASPACPITTVFEDVVPLNADCVEAVPAHVFGKPGYVAVAMYQLNEATQERCGHVKLLHVSDPDGASPNVVTVSDDTVSGVFDLKW